MVGPENKDQEVYLCLEHRDGSNDNIFATFDDPAALKEHLSNLSTYARFKRFAWDFLAERRVTKDSLSENAFPYREAILHGDRYAILALRYLAKRLANNEIPDVVTIPAPMVTAKRQGRCRCNSTH